MHGYRAIAARRHKFLSEESKVILQVLYKTKKKTLSIQPTATVRDLILRVSMELSLDATTVKVLGLDKSQLPEPKAKLLNLPIVRRWIDRFLEQDIPLSSTTPQHSQHVLKPIKIQVIGAELGGGEREGGNMSGEERKDYFGGGEGEDSEDDALKAAIALSLADQEETEEVKGSATPPEEDMNEEKQRCRICLGGRDEGQMFSPCLCRGSMQVVHVSCLNEWRRSSANPRSYYRCEQCHYEYQLRRAWFAELLLDDSVVKTFSVLALIGMMILSAFIALPVTYMLKVDLAEEMYRLCEWRPWWLMEDRYPWISSFRPTFDFIVQGHLFLATIGFAHWFYDQYLIHRHTADGWMRLLHMGAIFGGLQAGYRSARLALGLGSYFILEHLYNIAKVRCKYIVQTWGEAILEVRE
ncbi:hypothetical protein AAMO2058_001356700 [Amorphochlora amoebiformis]